MNLEYFFFQLWGAVVDHAIPLTALLLLAILVPRFGRLTIKIIEGRLDHEEESTKARLALLGALVYVLQIIAYFIIILLALSNLGVPPLGAAVPATIASAAIGFGAQSIIGDFLAGFFIISERQFGVGDYVSFDGTATATEGTVVALTLRATKVRTPSGEVVTIPNGSAGVITNYSQDWSRAVVNFDVPVRSGENLEEIQSIIENTAQAAVNDATIAEDVAGEIEILPATSLTAPTAAGQPWKVNFRILVVVNPARQWAVERGIRSALLNVFWDHFRTPFETPNNVLSQDTQAELDQIKDAKDATSPADASRTEIIPVAPGSDNRAAETPETAEIQEAVEQTERQEEELAPTAKDDGPGRPAQTATFDATSSASEDSERTDETDSTAAVADQKGLSKRRDFWRTDAYDKRWRKVMSFGGRIRVSTTGLILALIFTGGLALASSNPEDGNAGFLSPAYWQNRSAETTTETTETTEPETPLETPTQEPTLEPQPEPSTQPSLSEQPTEQDIQPNQEQLNEETNPSAEPSTQQTPSEESTATDGASTPGTENPNNTGNLGDTGAASQSDVVEIPEPGEELLP